MTGSSRERVADRSCFDISTKLGSMSLHKLLNRLGYFNSGTHIGMADDVA